MSLHRFTLSMRGSGVLSNVFALLLIAGLPVRADSVTYSFFGSAWLQDTSFTYVSPHRFSHLRHRPADADYCHRCIFYDISGAFFNLWTISGAWQILTLFPRTSFFFIRRQVAVSTLQSGPVFLMSIPSVQPTLSPAAPQFLPLDTFSMFSPTSMSLGRRDRDKAN
jgi:hypothetical protein